MWKDIQNKICPKKIQKKDVKNILVKILLDAGEISVSVKKTNYCSETVNCVTHTPVSDCNIAESATRNLGGPVTNLVYTNCGSPVAATNGQNFQPVPKVRYFFVAIT